MQPSDTPLTPNLTPEPANKPRFSVTKIVVVLSVFVVVVVILSTLSLLSHKGKVGVTVVALPSDSTLTVDGQKAKAGKMYLTKTTHTFKASRQYFGDATRTINLATYNASQIIYLLPEPNTRAAITYLSQHPDEQLKREGVATENVIKGQTQLNKDKLVPYLPYADPTAGYRIDYGTKGEPDGSEQITIYIESNSDAAKQQALDWIRSRGEDPSKLTIVYQPLSADYQPDQGGSEYQ